MQWTYLSALRDAGPGNDTRDSNQVVTYGMRHDANSSSVVMNGQAGPAGVGKSHVERNVLWNNQYAALIDYDL